MVAALLVKMARFKILKTKPNAKTVLLMKPRSRVVPAHLVGMARFKILKTKPNAKLVP